MNIRFSKKALLMTLLATTTAFAATALGDKINTVKMEQDLVLENPTTSYTLSGDVAKDNDRGLTWSRCLVGQTFSNNTCTGEPTEFASWDEALKAAEAKAAEGWRMPNIKELASITESEQIYPSMNAEVFTFASNQGQYRKPAIWSSTPIAGGAGTAFGISPSTGEVSAFARDTGEDRSKTWDGYAKQALYLLLVKDS